MQHLPTILRRVQAGELRVPAFQRGYVWDEKQIRELLQSVYKGYPIGSLLFWKTEELELVVESGDRFPFPLVQSESPVAFILDGMQRLATLYNCFFPVNASKFRQFNVAFDLRKQEFIHADKPDLTPAQIRLDALFSPKDFLARQRELAEQPDGDILLDRAIALYSKFQEYMIPTVTIEGRVVAEVVEIFERINYTGTRLSAVDFMRAVTWSPDFDLTVETGLLADRLTKHGFELPQETLVKLVAITQDKDPTLEEMLKLRGSNSATLKRSVKTVERVLGSVTEFLKDHLGILSYDYVPYEAQLLTLFKLFLKSDAAPSKTTRDTMRRWVWATSFNEELQGKADSVIATLLKNTEGLAAGDPRSTEQFDVRIEVEPQDLFGRRFIARSAVASALGTLFASQKARSVVTGEEIPPEHYMAEFSPKNYWPVFSLSELESVTRERFDTARFAANMIVVSTSDRKALQRFEGNALAEALSQMDKDLRNKTLASQAISNKAYKHIANDDPFKFFAQRCDDIVAAARRMIQ